MPISGLLVAGLTMQAEELVRAEEAPTTPAMDELGFRAFYGRTARPLRAYLVSSTGDADLADDLLQEAFFRLLRSGFVTDDENYRKNYLYRIATNLVRDHFRRRRDTVELDPETGHDDRMGDRVNLRSEVSRALGQLKARDRMMLWLAYVEGSDHREIAGCLGLKAASIRSMMFRARQRLAALLTGTGASPGERKT